MAVKPTLLNILVFTTTTTATITTTSTAAAAAVATQGKGKFRPRTGHKGPETDREVQFYSFFNLGTRWGGWLKPRPGRFTPRKETRYPFTGG